MSLNTADKVFLAVGLIDFAGIFIWIGVCLHLAYTKQQLMLGHLKNSSVLNTLTALSHGGPWGKLVSVGSISGIVTFPNLYIKRGLVSPEDLRHFPATLKRKLVILQWLGIGLLLLMVGLAVVVKLDLV